MNTKNFSRTSSQGFTLIELMIAVTIVGILAGIAYPNYTSSVQKSKRTEAMVALMQAAQKQEKYFSQNLKYAYNATTLGISTSTEHDLYTLSVAGTKSGGGACDATNACVSFTITATAKSAGSQYKDEACRVFTLQNTGAKASKDKDGAASTVCWQ